MYITKSMSFFLYTNILLFLSDKKKERTKNYKLSIYFNKIIV